MKVEMGESLCYSYLRHVKRCWLVQTNWKSSERWKKYRSDEDLETMYRTMKEKFDKSGEVFKKTKDAGQFMKQGEVDVVGVDPEGGVHALDVAFHEAGLLYGGGNDNRILKKLLRTYMLLHAYRPAGTRFHIYFVSPRVHVGPQKELEATFRALQAEYPEVRWCLMTNDDFAEQVVRATLDETSDVADTAELFVRAAKLMSLSGRWTRAGTSDHGIPRPAAENARERMTQGAGVTDKTDRQIQPLVRALDDNVARRPPHTPWGVRQVQLDGCGLLQAIGLQARFSVAAQEGRRQGGERPRSVLEGPLRWVLRLQSVVEGSSCLECETSGGFRARYRPEEPWPPGDAGVADTYGSASQFRPVTGSSGATRRCATVSHAFRSCSASCRARRGTVGERSPVNSDGRAGGEPSFAELAGSISTAPIQCTKSTKGWRRSVPLERVLLGRVVIRWRPCRPCSRRSAIPTS